MNNAFGVRGFNGGGDLRGEPQRFGRWNRLLPTGDNWRPVDVLHHQIIWPNVVNLADIGMIERGNGFGFTLKTLCELRGGHFDGDNAIQTCICGSIHFAHATGADLGFHTKGAELLSRGDLQARWIQQAVREFSCGAIQQPLVGASVKKQGFHDTPHLGIGLRQQRLSRLAGSLQRGVIKRFHLLPMFRIRWSHLGIQWQSYRNL